MRILKFAPFLPSRSLVASEFRCAILHNYDLPYGSMFALGRGIVSLDFAAELA